MPKATIEKLLAKAKRGDAKAQSSLGHRYECGKGVAKHEFEPEKWYLLAAEQGDESAQISLVSLYSQFRSTKIQPDEKAAAKWALAAAKLGNPDLQFVSAVNYEKGCGVDKDNSQAIYWYSKAAAQGHRESFTALGGMTESQIVQPNAALASIVGNLPMSRSELDCKILDYIRNNKLQNISDPCLISPDAQLQFIFLGKSQLRIHEIADILNYHLTCIADKSPDSCEIPLDIAGSQEDNRFGYVYVLVNSSMPGLLKIGYTDRDPNLRAKELSAATGIVFPFIVAYYAETLDAPGAEEEIHRILSPYRINDNREFFSMEVRDAISTIDSVCGRFGLVSSPQNEELVYAQKVAKEEELDEWACAASTYLYRNGYIDHKIIRSQLGYNIDYLDSVKVFELLIARGVAGKDGRKVGRL